MNKQLLSIEGNTLYVQCPRLDTTSQATATIVADVQDKAFFESHRCRVIKGQLITTAVDRNTGYEKPASVVHLLTKHEPDTRIIHADANPLNLKRSNLRTRSQTVMNEYDSDANVSYLSLPNGQLCYIDTVDVEKASKYQWATMVSHNRFVIGATYYQGDSKRTLMLPRYLLDLDAKDRRVVTHINHDILDCRRANLQVMTRG